MKITAEVWSRVSPLLDDALELAPALRQQWLDSQAGEAPEVRETLRALLLADSQREVPDLPPLDQLVAGYAEVPFVAGDLIGPYRLIRQLGVGGMALVWLAERADGSPRRPVALKLPRVAILGNGLAARMAHERDILAVLEHPNIARLYDAGVDVTGQPFLALEYVDGAPLDEYSREQALSLRQRIDLFLQVARAVEFAHARLIVHRDLKPSNILVNAAGEARLLDFGVARLLLDELSHGPNHTQFGTRPLTPGYAAPEQFSGQPITVATDVYSLGVILYELLTGFRPCEPRRNSAGAVELAVLECEPALASSVTKVMARRALRGDLDVILDKALKKAPADRYRSVEAFVTDLERHLAGEPIVARPASRWYLAHKFVRRHALPLIAATTVTLAMVIGLSVAVWQWNAATRQRAFATERLGQTRATLDFTKAVLTEGVERGETVTLDQLLTRSEAMAETSGRSDAQTRAAATEFVSGWYLSYGLFSKAEELLTRAINELPFAGHSTPIPWFICKRAVVWSHLGRRDEAITALMSEIERNKDDAETAGYCLEDRAQVAREFNDAAGALSFALQALHRLDEAGGQSLSDKANLLGSIGYGYSLNGKTDEAQDYYEQALNLFARSGRSQSADAKSTLEDLAGVVVSIGDPLRALPLLERTLVLSRRHSPTQDADAVLVINQAILLRVLGKYAEAAAALDSAAAPAERGGSLEFQASVLNSKADLATLRGDLDESQSLLDQAATKLREGKVPSGSAVMLRQQLFQGQLWAARGQLSQAIAVYTDLIDEFTRLGCCRSAKSRVLVSRAAAAAADHHLDSALADAQHALELAQSAQGSAPFSNYTGSAWLAIGRIRQAQGRRAEARSAYEYAETNFTHTLGEQHPDTVKARQALREL